MLNDKLSKLDTYEMRDIYREIEQFEKTGSLENGILRKLFEESEISNTSVFMGVIVVYQELAKRWYEEYVID